MLVRPDAAVGFDDLRSALEILNDSEYKFFLTGSRRFGNSRSGSDYDFFVQDDGNVTQWLLRCGFVKITDESGYTLIPDALVYRKQNVDVQVRSNAELFEKINRYLDTKPEAYRYIASHRGDAKVYRALWLLLERVV